MQASFMCRHCSQPLKLDCVTTQESTAPLLPPAEVKLGGKGFGVFPVESEVSDRCKELLIQWSGVCVLSKGTAGFLGCVQQFAEEAEKEDFLTGW
ncbi:hypothetical protein Celaphus_00004353, partial [Cervus elaphus hippelaphus]